MSAEVPPTSCTFTSALSSMSSVSIGAASCKQANIKGVNPRSSGKLTRAIASRRSFFRCVLERERAARSAVLERLSSARGLFGGVNSVLLGRLGSRLLPCLVSWKEDVLPPSTEAMGLETDSKLPCRAPASLRRSCSSCDTAAAADLATASAGLSVTGGSPSEGSTPSERYPLRSMSSRSSTIVSASLVHPAREPASTATARTGFEHAPLISSLEATSSCRLE